MAKCESCHNCVYSRWNPGQWLASLSSGFPARPTCANQPDSPGRWKDCPRGRVCRNYRAKPPIPTGETVKTIPLGDGVVAYVDAEDYEWLSQWNWHLHCGYAVRWENRTPIFMHRQVMNPPEGMVVDHKNRNKLDDTRENLRVSTPQENAHNKGKQGGSSSRFKGVGYNKQHRKWYASLSYESDRIWLGYFDDESEAARAYDRAAVEYFGAFAHLNFPEEWPAERRAEVKGQGKRKKARGKSAKATGRIGKTTSSSRRPRQVKEKARRPRGRRT